MDTMIKFIFILFLISQPIVADLNNPNSTKAIYDWVITHNPTYNTLKNQAQTFYDNAEGVGQQKWDNALNAFVIWLETWVETNNTYKVNNDIYARVLDRLFFEIIFPDLAEQIMIDKGIVPPS